MPLRSQKTGAETLTLALTSAVPSNGEAVGPEGPELLSGAWMLLEPGLVLGSCARLGDAGGHVQPGQIQPIAGGTSSPRDWQCGEAMATGNG